MFPWLVAENRLSGLFFVDHDVPRSWLPEEIVFVQGGADRTWVALATADALAELRTANTGPEQTLRQRTADRDRLWMLSRDLILVAQFDETISAVSPAWEAVLGWRENQLVGRALLDLLHPDDVESTRIVAGMLDGGGVLPTFENCYRQADGSYRWIAWTASQGDGVIAAVGRDVTHAKVQAESLREAAAQLRQSQKMEAVAGSSAALRTTSTIC